MNNWTQLTLFDIIETNPTKERTLPWAQEQISLS